MYLQILYNVCSLYEGMTQIKTIKMYVAVSNQHTFSKMLASPYELERSAQSETVLSDYEDVFDFFECVIGECSS